MGFCCKPARILKFFALTCIAFAIFAFLNLFIEPRVSLNEEWPVESVANRVPRNHLEFADWEVNQKGPGEQGEAVTLEGKEKELGDQAMKQWYMNLYAR
jgi:hypothetical protein